MNAERKIDFEGVIGQESAKQKISFYLENHIKNKSIVPNILLTGSKGDGKTHLARQIARNLPDFNDLQRKCKKFYNTDGPSISSLSVLFEDLSSQFANGDDYATIFIDEAHDLPTKVQTALLRVLEPNNEGLTRYTYNDVEYIFDFKKVTFILATTEDDKIFHALKDRLEEVQLYPYEPKELAEIISNNLGDDVEISGEILDNLSLFVRRNARSATKIAQKVKSLGVRRFHAEHLNSILHRLNMFPSGISSDEFRMLETLEKDGESSLGFLSSRLGKPSRAVQKEIEPYPITLGLMAIDGKRKITGAGRQFLKECRDFKNTLDKLTIKQ